MAIPEGFNSTEVINKAVADEAKRISIIESNQVQERLKRQIDTRAEEVVDNLRARAGWTPEKNGRDAPAVILGREETAEHGIVTVVGVVGIRGISSFVNIGVVLNDTARILNRIGTSVDNEAVKGICGQSFSSYQQCHRGGIWDRVPITHLEPMQAALEIILESSQNVKLNPDLNRESTQEKTYAL